jgi:hypothetical protein
MKRAHSTLALLIFAGTTAAEELPPRVLLLSRVKNHMKEELHSLSSISCLETVQRSTNPN